MWKSRFACWNERRTILTVLFLVLAVWIIFYSSLRGEFLRWDDDINITTNVQVHGLDGKRIAWMFTDLQQALRYKPLTWLTWSLIYQWCGLNALGYHLCNLLFHSLNSVLVFFVIRKILGWRRASIDFTGANLTRIHVSAALAALLWAIHPLRVEPVAWATGLPYCQSLFCLLLSTLCYLEANEAAGKFKVSFYWLSVVAYAFSLLFYPVVLGYALVLVVADFYPLRLFNSGPLGRWDATARRVWARKIPFAALTGLFLLVALYARMHPGSLWAQPPALEKFGLVDRAMQAFYIWSYYFWKPFFPSDLSPVYTTLVSFQPIDKPFIMSLLLVLAITLLLIWKRRVWPGTLTLWLGHLFLLIPVLGLTQHPHYSSDRYCYVASIIWAIFIGGVLWKWSTNLKQRVMVWGLATGVACVLGAMSLQQIKVWQNSEALFERILTKLGDDPERFVVHKRLATILAQQRNHKGAAEHYRIALQTYGNDPETLKQLALILVTADGAQVRNGAEAVQLARRACEITRYEDAALLSLLAAAYAEAGRYEDADATAQKAYALALSAGEQQLAATNKKLLDYYRSKRTYRDLLASPAT